MNKGFFSKVAGLGILNAILVLLAAALGADSAFAMSEVTVVSGTEEKIDDSKGMATQNPGVGASQSSAVESDFTPEEIEQAIAEFQAYNTPVEASISLLAEKVNVSAMEVIHYRSATPVFTVQTINGSAVKSEEYGPDQTISLTIGTDIERKVARLLYECKNVFVQEGEGYVDDGSATRDGMLALYVLKNDRSTGGKIVFRVLNPCTAPSQEAGGVLASIPANAHLIIGTTAASESQREVAPDNFEPVPFKVYLQKRLFNIVMTTEWINGKKKVKFAEEDMRKGALYAYKIGNEICDLIGTQSKFKVEAGRQMADEFTYTSRGILRQANLYYSYEDKKLKAEDLTAIAKAMFTKFSANNEAQVFCGQDFIEGLLNMDLTIHKEIKFEDVSVGGMTIKAWKNNFGTLNFVYCPVFDLLGYDKYAFACDLKNARCYTKRAATMETVDMRQGATETREAKRDIYSQIYAVALRGYNAILIGPASGLASAASEFSNLERNIVKVAVLPADGYSTSTIYYLSAASNGFDAGSFVERNENNTGWKLYNGPVSV